MKKSDQRIQRIRAEGFGIARNWSMKGALHVLGPVEWHYRRPKEAAAFIEGMHAGDVLWRMEQAGIIDRGGAVPPGASKASRPG